MVGEAHGNQSISVKKFRGGQDFKQGSQTSRQNSSQNQQERTQGQTDKANFEGQINGHNSIRNRRRNSNAHHACQYEAHKFLFVEQWLE
jgi:hypothetical protein